MLSLFWCELVGGECVQPCQQKPKTMPTKINHQSTARTRELQHLRQVVAFPLGRLRLGQGAGLWLEGVLWGRARPELLGGVVPQSAWLCFKCTMRKKDKEDASLALVVYAYKSTHPSLSGVSRPAMPV